MSGAKPVRAWAIRTPKGRVNPYTVGRTKAAAWDAFWRAAPKVCGVSYLLDFIQESEDRGYRAVRVRVRVTEETK